MKKNLLSFISLLALVLLSGCAKDEEVLTGTIAGFVSDYTNANTAVAGATVTLNTKGLTKTTGSDGRFEFTDLEPDTYSLSVAANGYQPNTKQVTVYAAQTANCDFQLEKGGTSVSIDPLNIVFGRTVEQASFTITNNTNGSLSYSISNYPDYLQVSPSSGTIAAKGKQAVGLSIVNRSSITTARNGQITVNVGSDSYVVSISVEPWADEKVNVDINPQSLSFDSDTEQLSFTMTSNNSFANNYTLSTNLDVLTLSQESGTLLAHGQNTISVTVKNRKEIDAARNGQVTINMEGNTYIVSVHIDKYVEGGGDDPNPATDVVDGLTAYFTFEGNYNDQTETGLTGVGVGTSFVESFDGSQALNIPANENAYLSIPNSLVDQKQMSISFWVKDLNDGHVFHAVSNNNYLVYALIMSNGMLKFIADDYYVSYPSYKSGFTHNKLSGWNMVTLVSDYGVSATSTTTTKLYINGVYCDIVTENTYPSGLEKCTKFVLGSGISTYQGNVNPTRLVIDNLRVYKYRRLSDDEVKNIYNIERRSK